ncbi:MAG: S49 family peptidase [Longimicrobiales bacterium]
MSKKRGRTTANRLMQSLVSAEWAIRPEWLEQFAGIAERLNARGDGALTAEELRAEVRRALATLMEGHAPADGEQQALAFSYGDPLHEDSRATVRDGVAIIPVIGPLYHYADEIHDHCGCTSYEQLARDIRAVRDAGDQVRAAVFEFDTPGGIVGGCAEAAALIAELGDEMHTVGYVSDWACSAGFWLLSATNEIVLSPTALVGSIGVVAAYRRRVGEGNVIEIVSSQSPKKRPDVNTEGGRKQVQATLDALADVFVGDVARFHGVSVETVLAEFGQGDVLVGARAIDAGMADRVGSLESVLAELARDAATGGNLNPEGTMPAETNATPAAETPANSAITAEAIDRDHPAIAKHFRDEGRAEGVTQERQRITKIRDLTLAGQEELATQCVNDGTSAEAFAVKQIEAQRAAASKAAE